ncbi:MAG: insulinase family protein, partial [Clostridia bacterium]|nr:insulinase family protein [Clostridia bacterium]
MTNTASILLNHAATLRHTRDDRFKTARLSLFAVMPADAAGSPLTTLLFGILRRGSEHYPRLSLLNRRLDELYGTTLTIRNYLHGDAHVVCYTAEMPEQDFLPSVHADMDILGGVMELLADMILHPLREEDGVLRADAVEKEKQSLCDSIRSLRNDTRAYAGTRLREIMCHGEPYGLSIGGTVEQVSAITPAEV